MTPARRQRGFGGIVIIAILVVLALVGTFVVTTVGTQHMSTALSWRGMQAWFAADAGADWAIARLLAGDGCTELEAGSFVVEGFAVSIENCAGATVGEGTTPYDVFQFTAVAQGGTQGVDFASRRMSMVVHVP